MHYQYQKARFLEDDTINSCLRGKHVWVKIEKPTVMYMQIPVEGSSIEYRKGYNTGVISTVYGRELVVPQEEIELMNEFTINLPYPTTREWCEAELGMSDKEYYRVTTEWLTSLKEQAA